MAGSMTGEQIQALADALKPLQPKDLGPAVQGFAISFGVISVVVVCLRIYVRAGLSGVSPKLLGLEDYLSVLATIPQIPSVVFAVLAARYGVGCHDANIPSPMYLIRAVEYQTYWELLYFISSTIIKCAIGFTCVRLDRRKRVVIPIYVNMMVMVIVCILALAFVFANCKPFAATWNPSLGTCQKTISLQTVSYIVSAIQMATDWACAIIPFFIVAGLQMSRRRKISVIAILGLGITASIATCIRMPYLKYYDTVKYPDEIAYHLGVISITSNIECSLGIIACSLPPLRKLFNFYYGSSHEGDYKYTGGSGDILGSSGPGIRLDSVNGRKGTFHASAHRVPSRARENETDDDNSSSKGIIRKTEPESEDEEILWYPEREDNHGHLESRIAALEELVRSYHQELKNANNSTPPRPRDESQSQLQSYSNARHAPLPEGESSFGRQALHASQVLEISASEASQSPAFMQEMAKLHGMAHESGVSATNLQDYSFGADWSSPRPDVDPGVDLPSSALVLQVLRLLKKQPGTQCLMFTFYGIRGCEQIEDLCKRIYFPIEPLNRREVALFYGILGVILYELPPSDESDLSPEDIASLRKSCEDKFHASIEMYEVMLIPTGEHIRILSLAMIHAQFKAKLPLQWSLASTAARHCLALGYHREDRLSQLPSDEAERARRLFWIVFLADTSLSARFGRPSTIQDYDLDVNMCPISKNPGLAPWDIAFASFCELSKIQSQIFVSLYSSSAKKASVTERAEAASRLESTLVTWYQNWHQLDSSKVCDHKVFSATFGPARVAYYSILTLIHRGTILSTSARDISPACFEAAHLGLEAHLTYYPSLVASGKQALSAYAFWILYYISFTPFVVTFLHCVANSSLDDLNLLKDVLASLEQIGLALEYAEKQYNLCKALYQIAEAFLNSKHPAVGDEPQTTSRLTLPLQSPFLGTWSWLDPNFQLSGDTANWDISTLDHTMFELDHQM
ncbi:hypothetical protein FDECE_5036 [Fusarium decemcellulare]|nr:hypothetical protein FDECE_5036 [Fusarium decemcellulare]